MSLRSLHSVTAASFESYIFFLNRCVQWFNAVDRMSERMSDVPPVKIPLEQSPESCGLFLLQSGIFRVEHRKQATLPVVSFAVLYKIKEARFHEQQGCGLETVVLVSRILALDVTASCCVMFCSVLRLV